MPATNDDYFLYNSLQISRSTYYRKLKEIREGKPLDRKKGSGRPRKTAGNLLKKTASIALKSLYISAQKIALKLKTEDGINVHKATVQRTLKISTFGENSRKNLGITAIHEEKLIFFAKNWKNYGIEDVQKQINSLVFKYWQKINNFSSQFPKESDGVGSNFSPSILKI